MKALPTHTVQYSTVEYSSSMLAPVATVAT